MKKFISVLVSCLLVCICFATFASAEGENTAEVYVSIANKSVLTASYEKVTVTDIDADGKLTVNDALYAVHAKKYDGGADAGYNYYRTEQYGLSIGTLWGDKSGCFGYYINNASAWSLEDIVKNGDHVYAFVYTDTENWSDSYSFFSESTVSVDNGSEIMLTLSKSGYDADWNPITVAVEGATITVDGIDTDIKTDANGKAVIKITDSGNFVISAKHESEILVPPVCIASVKAEESNVDSNVESSVESNVESSDESEIPQAGDNSSHVMFIVLSLISMISLSAVALKMRRNEF